MSLNAYQQVRTLAETPRAMERRLIGQITGQMIALHEAGISGSGLMPALHRNREMWNMFAALCGGPGNELPNELRASLVSIGLWVDRYTSEVIAGRDSIEPLIEVNRSILEGLADTVLAA
ncbi:flagellar biosynthesis regulator FlaF [Stakelama pacifica]|uniref:Flagellar protein FlaF n=1 Tax=Stakelama pacifica TaxID=517720 RepID=A0A4V3BSX7_9SPHN|nr:flagellar biosynthesis regulator FlaF [Stakelama pacifica]MAW98810.1 flagellar FlaF family protein [Sphingomonas sp.]TDN81148.1 flagellar protein FlaF [Stakelama pacifica]GGO96894.1 flagellar biosynthesis regulatory protein FlaF [Stakelama pacifica]